MGRKSAKSRTGAFILSGLSVFLIGSCSVSDPSGCGVPPQGMAIAANSVAAPIMTASIVQSRRASLQDGTRPVPARVRSTLQPFFDERTLDSVRWTVSADRLSLDTVIVAVFPRYRAMTFQDTIVFQTEADADDLGLWVHELLHVEQVRRAGGISRFSRVYLAKWADIEAATVRQTNRILMEADAPLRQGQRSLTRGCITPT